MLKKWPMDPTRPTSQNAIAETYDQLQRHEAPGHARARRDRAEGARGAHQARELRRQHAVGRREQGQPRGDPERRAPRARRSPPGGRAAHEQRQARSSPRRRAPNEPGSSSSSCSRAPPSTSSPRIGWSGYLKQDENAPDAYESRYWLADARHQYVRIAGRPPQGRRRSTYPEPSKKDIDEALAAAIDVRDSNEDDKYLDNAALLRRRRSATSIAISRTSASTTRRARRASRSATRSKFDSGDEATRKQVATDPGRRPRSA